MRDREHHLLHAPQTLDPELIMALGHMTAHFGRLEDMLKIMQAHVDGVDPDDFIRQCGLDKKTAHKIFKDLGQYYDPAVVEEIHALFKIRNEFMHSSYTIDADGHYLRLCEGADQHDKQGDITQINNATAQAITIIPRLAGIQPIQVSS